MEDEFERARARIPSQSLILEAVDEYTLYCFYTGIHDLIPGVAYNSPLRTENHPSFAVYYSRKYEDIEFMWKDFKLGESGSIFKLVRLLFDLKNDKEVYAKISQDFGLGLDLPEVVTKIRLYNPPSKLNKKIRVSSIPFTNEALAYWEQFGIGERILQKYCVTQVSHYWTFDGQPYPRSAFNLTFAYRVGKYYQLYSPYAPKAMKFRSDLPENYFFGYLQLPETGSMLVIDKSMKDVMFCSVLNIPAVAGKSEVIHIPHQKILELRNRFDSIFLTLDPDDAGRKQAEVYVSRYPWLKPRFLSEAKDKTDLCLKVGKDRASTIIKQMLQ